MKTLGLVGTCILSILAFGCQHSPSSTDESPTFVSIETQAERPWTELGFLNDPNNFQFAIVADLTGGYRSGVFEDAAKKINLMQPEFVLSVGDLIEGYTEDRDTIDDQWAEFEKRIAPLGMKFFFVPGNHDLSNLTMTQEWEKRFGRSYYHFVYRDVLFLCLNSEDPPHTQMSDDQIDYVGEVLEEYPDVRWTFAFLHKPLWLERDTGWEKVEAMLAGRSHTVLAGHHHTYTKYHRNGQSYIRLATTGGGSQLGGPVLGQFDHITWVTVTDKGPILANLGLDGIYDEDVVTEKTLQLIEYLMSEQWLEADSIVVGESGLKSDTISIRLANDGWSPLNVSGVFMPHRQFKFSQSRIRATVPPGQTKDIQVEINADSQIKLDDIAPFELRLTGFYQAVGHLPIVTESIRRIDFRHPRQGPEKIRNGLFSHGLEGWQMAVKTAESATVSTDAKALDTEIHLADPAWALVVFQPIGKLKAGTRYQLACRIGGARPQGFISAVIKDGFADSPNVPIRSNGTTQPHHLIPVTTSMVPYTFEFQLAGGKSLESAILLLAFLQEDTVTIDDISLRSIEGTTEEAADRSSGMLDSDSRFRYAGKPSFSITFPPGSQRIQTDAPDQVFAARTKEGVTVQAAVNDIWPESTLGQWAQAYVDTIVSQGIARNPKITVNTEATLACGTKAYRSEIQWLHIPSGSRLLTQTMAAFKDGETVFVTAHPLANPERVIPIVESLRFD